MNQTPIILLSFLFFISSCLSEKEPANCSSRQQNISLKQQLTGVGKIGLHPDSLGEVFYYFPIPESEENSHSFFARRIHPILSGDTLLFSPLFLFNLMPHSSQTTQQDTVAYRIKRLSPHLFQLEKVSTSDIFPARLYFQHYTTQLPESFRYFRLDITFRRKKIDIELADTNFIKILTSSNRDSSLLITIGLHDKLFIHQYINALIDVRNSATESGIICTHGYRESQTLVYQDTIFEYNHLQFLKLSSSVLRDYFFYSIPDHKSVPFRSKDPSYSTRFTPYRNLPQGNVLSIELPPPPD